MYCLMRFWIISKKFSVDDRSVPFSTMVVVLSRHRSNTIGSRPMKEYRAIRSPPSTLSKRNELVLFSRNRRYADTGVNMSASRVLLTGMTLYDCANILNSSKVIICVRVSRELCSRSVVVQELSSFTTALNINKKPLLVFQEGLSYSTKLTAYAVLFPPSAPLGRYQYQYQFPDAILLMVKFISLIKDTKISGICQVLFLPFSH